MIVCRIAATARAGALAEKQRRYFADAAPPAMPVVTEALRKAAYDPRVRGVLLRIEPLAIGWARVQEIRRHVEFFRASGKETVAFVTRGGEREYYLATACAEVVAPRLAGLYLKGLSGAMPYVKGTLDKLGVESEVRTLTLCSVALHIVDWY
jgi:protease IV